MSKNNCPIEKAFEIIGGRWKSSILWNLLENTKRYSELKKLNPKITEKMLTQQLRALEKDKLITRKVYHEVPPKVEYTLTPLGKTLSPILKSLHAWSVKHL